MNAHVYRDAAQAIRSRGLGKGEFSDEQGRLCTVGALSLVVNGHPELAVKEDVVAPLAELIGVRPELGGTYCTVTDWNDKPERTQEDVVLLLEQVAEKIEAGVQA